MQTDLLERVTGALDDALSVDVTQELVRTDSTCGKEAVLAAELEERIRAIGVGRVWREEVFDGRSNTLWEVDSGRPGPHLLFTGHLDTKPVCEGWTRDPFDGAIENGRMFGHGVMDMKAGLGCQVGAIKTILDSGIDFSGRITFAAVCDHMGDQTGSIDLFRRHSFDHCILGELTGMEIYVAHRGATISTSRRSASPPTPATRTSRSTPSKRCCPWRKRLRGSGTSPRSTRR